MSFFKQRPLTPTDEAAQEDHLKRLHLDELWEHFFFTRNPAALASFVRQGGDISDQETRDLIANLLDEVKFKHSRARPIFQADYYMAVKELLRQGVIGVNGKPISQAEAIRQAAEKTGISEKAGISRFSAGKALVGG
jgi:hypothetical protein